MKRAQRGGRRTPGSGDNAVARIGPIVALPQVLAELGVEPQRVFRKARVNQRLFDDTENYISYRALDRLLTVSADLTGCRHFGLLVGARATLSDFGVLGQLMRNSATVGEALRVLLVRLHIQDRLAVPILLQPAPSTALIGYSIDVRFAQDTQQFLDGAIAIAYQILVELGGPTWKAVHVQFAHRRSEDVAVYRQVFRTSVRYDAEVSGVVFRSSWLERPIDGADPDVFRRLGQTMERAEAAWPMTFAERVRRLLHQLVLGGSLAGDHVASKFGISERTLRLRLHDEGTSLQALLDEVRFTFAKQLMQNTRLPLSDVAFALRYADPAVFSRAFRRWAGVSPRQWRSALSALRAVGD